MQRWQVEKLLDEVEAADGGAAAGSGGSGTEADLDARVRLYERVASEVIAHTKCTSIKALLSGCCMHDSPMKAACCQ